MMSTRVQDNLFIMGRFPKVNISKDSLLIFTLGECKKRERLIDANEIIQSETKVRDSQGEKHLERGNSVSTREVTELQGEGGTTK